MPTIEQRGLTFDARPDRIDFATWNTARR